MFDECSFGDPHFIPFLHLGAANGRERFGAIGVSKILQNRMA